MSRLERIKAFGLGLPEAWEDFPWGESALKVRKKVFVFLWHNAETGVLSISMKLPYSNADALEHEACTPTGYSLGKSGWVTVKLTEDDPFDDRLLIEWVLESYRAVAPKTSPARSASEPHGPQARASRRASAMATAARGAGAPKASWRGPSVAVASSSRSST